MNRLSRRTAIGGLLSAVSTAHLGGAWAQSPVVSAGSRLVPAEEDAIVMSLDAWTDAYGRPIASVMLNGRGPYSFLVDTGSTVTVISERLAQTLGVVRSGTFTVAGATGTAIKPFTILETLQAGDVRLNKLRVAIMSDGRFARCEGILGADAFAGKRLVFSIRDKIVRVEPSLRLVRGPARGNLRLRHGMLAEVDGRVGRIPAKLMLDTGADYCVANPALGAALRKAYPQQGRIPNVRIVGVTGHRVSGEFIFLPPVDASAFSVTDSGAVIADASIFKLWELESEPAMIVGVDLLSRLASFTIDYGARTFDAELAMDLIAENQGAQG